MTTKMKLTASRLIRWTGLAAVVAGIIFVGIQPILNQGKSGYSPTAPGFFHCSLTSQTPSQRCWEASIMKTLSPQSQPTSTVLGLVVRGGTS